MKPPPGNGAGSRVSPREPGKDVLVGNLDAVSFTTTRPPAPTEIPARRRWISPEVAERRRWLAHRAADYAASGEMPLAWHALYMLGLIAKRQAVTA